MAMVKDSDDEGGVVEGPVRARVSRLMSTRGVAYLTAPADPLKVTTAILFPKTKGHKDKGWKGEKQPRPQQIIILVGIRHEGTIGWIADSASPVQLT